ncbi:MAG: hypothetical protein HWD85_05170 [Flavobacteriaceae bacterium]|nr:hypothetical protein [Flavobacteriaceae bacterium]
MKSIFKITVLFFLIPLISVANTKPRHEKSKTIKKEYTVSKDATVAISNKYGAINITTWNKNRVEITVKITVKGNNPSRVEKKLRTIYVDFEGNSNRVSAKTKFERGSSSWSFWGKNNNTSYQIDYTIKMPVSNNVKLSNDYGSILLNELDGAADINCDYGKLIIGDLNNTSNNINIDYCKSSTINFMKRGSVNADYSKLTIDKTDDAKVNADYSNITIEAVNNVNFNADYGNITVNDVKDIKGNTDYVTIRLGTVSKNLHLNADYGSIKIKELANGFERAEISSEYTGINIGVKPSSNFNFMIDLQYASFRYDDAKVDMRKSIRNSTKKYYEGTYGNSKNNSKLIIKSQYGSVRIKE